MANGAMELRLHSPAGAEPVVYTWPLSSSSVNRAFILITKQIDHETAKNALQQLCSTWLPVRAYVSAINHVFTNV